MRPDEVLDTLQRAGFEAWYVGGCVRDTLLGRPIHDWDVTTSALPEQVLALFPRTVPTGLQHGTVTVLSDSGPVEVTTYRADGDYHDGRHPDGVRFVRSLREDTARRDFTVNAMAMDQRGNIRDFYGGRADLAAGILRCVGAPERRFREDALRMLRACRFAAQLGFGLLTSCCLTGSHDLSQLSALPPTAEARWAGFGLLVPELDFSAFRLPAKLVKLCRMARAHWPAPEERLGWKRLLAAEGEEAARLLATLAQTDAVDKILASGDCVSLKTLAVSGRDFPLLRGPALGQLLNRLLEHVLQAPADNNRETLLELSKKFESPS